MCFSEQKLRRNKCITEYHGCSGYKLCSMQIKFAIFRSTEKFKQFHRLIKNLFS